jgi:hypothetical protein
MMRLIKGNYSSKFLMMPKKQLKVQHKRFAEFYCLGLNDLSCRVETKFNRLLFGKSGY